MDIFQFRDGLIDDYKQYVTSYIHIRDGRIRDEVDRSLAEGALWPDPLVQLNPAFEPGESIDELVARGALHLDCAEIFRAGKTADGGRGAAMRLHRHQCDAIAAAAGGANYVLTTGTGSGKSLAYIIPMVDRALREAPREGVRGIVVYPMNALANSQAGELEKFLEFGDTRYRGRVRYARYTGQESDEQRRRICEHPPHILLTNYVMLELILTRPDERPLLAHAQDLGLLVLDELHTYRGRQGADVALLVRRVREALNAHRLQCAGTSATLAGPGTYEEQRTEVARVATQLFGGAVLPENVIGETLRRATDQSVLTGPAAAAALVSRVADQSWQAPTAYAEYARDPLVCWIESELGVESVDGRLVRRRPRALSGPNGAAAKLAEATGQPQERCAAAIRTALLAAEHCEGNPQPSSPALAFRLHQFISRGDAAYASVEAEQERYITIRGQQFVPGDRSLALFPLAFCRECGQEFYTVRHVDQQFFPRPLGDRAPEPGTAGFLYMSKDKPWPSDPNEVAARVPEDWLDADGSIARSRRAKLPQAFTVSPDGSVGPGVNAWFLKSPFEFCPACGVAYTSNQKDDFGKLSALSSEGRSTATTILSLSTIRLLRATANLPAVARKLLSFTDNRQDASLQAGHLNDFVEVGQLRAALYVAVQHAGASGLRHDVLPARVFDALNLPKETYCLNPDARFGALEDAQSALRAVLEYHLYRDLRRGWRVTSPNLEQLDLLRIRYRGIEEVCAAEDIWASCHAALRSALPETRATIARTLLDMMRRDLSIFVDALKKPAQEVLARNSTQHLRPPWALDEGEPLEQASVTFPGRRVNAPDIRASFASPRGGFGRYLRRQSTFPEYGEKLNVEETEHIIRQLLQALASGGMLRQAAELGPDRLPGYQVAAAAIVWTAGQGEQPFHDVIRVPSLPEGGGRVNPYFKQFYKGEAQALRGVKAREHTAQVPAAERQKREDQFREAKLPILYCSPTMELGVDISQLNVVNLRNVPPTPANYAQRSGRAGRSGQPAIVFSYCTTGSPHDQFFFRHPDQMVSGQVAPPRIDLANEDLVRAHVHAVWLAASGLSLGKGLGDVLDVSVEGQPVPRLKLLSHVQDALDDPGGRQKALLSAGRVLKTLDTELQGAGWCTADWLAQCLSGIGPAFERACDRWRGLFKSAHAQQIAQNAIVMDHTKPREVRDQARRLRYEAERQRDLLLDASSVFQSDFYSYRYFASEGFLPGYSFPRLPLTAYIPPRKDAKDDEFVSRPRFLAISEFGPRALVYHEGSRYEITRVILPVERGEDQGLPLSQSRLCPACGYLHPFVGGVAADVCERCGAGLEASLTSLFRLQNVSTRRRQRISCDEEERARLGFELKTALRFADVGAGPVRSVAEAADGEGQLLARLEYAHTATLWRINMGWRRRKEDGPPGFLLDPERGYWARNHQDPAGDPGPGDEEEPRAQAVRVIPYVEDRRNALLFQPGTALTAVEMASLQSALKGAIQVRYQLEDQELAAEPLPDAGVRNVLLFYESAEGGAGVLRHLIDNPAALPAVAAEALRLCHFDPATGEDLRRAEGAREDCEAACYDCLLSYRNQQDHHLLDRAAIRDILLALCGAQVAASPGAASRSEHLARLMATAGSELEKRWLRAVDSGGYKLPAAGQKLISECGTRPDFIYDLDGYLAAVYIDGPAHEYPDRRERDQAASACLEDIGYLVVRFGALDDWPAILARNPGLFGERQ